MSAYRKPIKTTAASLKKEEELFVEHLDQKAELERENKANEVAAAQSRGDLDVARYLAKKYELGDQEMAEMRAEKEATREKVFRDKREFLAKEDAQARAKAKAAAVPYQAPVHDAPPLLGPVPIVPPVRLRRVRGQEERTGERPSEASVAAAERTAAAMERLAPAARRQEEARVLAELEAERQEEENILRTGAQRYRDESEIADEERTVAELERELKEYAEPEEPESAAARATPKTPKTPKTGSLAARKEAIIEQTGGQTQFPTGRLTAKTQKPQMKSINSMNSAELDAVEASLIAGLPEHTPGSHEHRFQRLASSSSASKAPIEEEEEEPAEEEDPIIVAARKALAGSGVKRGRRDPTSLPGQYIPLGSAWEVDRFAAARGLLSFRTQMSHKRLVNKVAVALSQHPTPALVRAVMECAETGDADRRHLDEREGLLIDGLLHLANGGRLTGPIAAALGFRPPMKNKASTQPKAAATARAPRRQMRASAPPPKLEDQSEQSDATDIILGELEGGLASTPAYSALRTKLRRAYRDGRISREEFDEGVRHIRAAERDRTDAEDTDA